MSIELPCITVIPAHEHEPMQRATADGLVDDPACGYHHRIDDETGLFCGESVEHRVHNGSDWKVQAREWTDEEIERANR